MLTNSFLRKVVATIGAAVGFVFVYETTVRDSRSVPPVIVAEAAVNPTTPLAFTATAYCKGDMTASGAMVRTGVAAADPALLPVGSVVRIADSDPKYDGVWTVMDTGPAVQGRLVDLYMWSCHEALRFGRRSIQLSVLRLGWNPQNSEPGLVDAMFKRRERERAEMPLPSRRIDPLGILLPTAPGTPDEP